MAAETHRIEIVIEGRDNTDPGISQATRKVSAFDRASQKTQERLEKMNRTKYQVVVDALDRASGTIGAVSAKAKALTSKTYGITINAVDKASRIINQIKSTLAPVALTAGAGMGVMAGYSLKLAGDMEQARIAMDFFTGSAQKGKEFLEELTAFAAATPFEFPFLQESAIGLMGAYKGVMDVDSAMKQTMRTIKAFGDAAGLTGAGMQGMELSLLGFKQIGMVGTLGMEELRQVTENLRIPMTMIQKELGLTSDQMKNLGDQGIPASKAMEAILKALEENFSGGMKKLSESLLGLMSTAKDTARFTVTAFGDGMAGPIKRILTDIVGSTDYTSKEFQKFLSEIKDIGKNVGEALEKGYNKAKKFFDLLSSNEEFQKMDWGDKIVYALDQMMVAMDEWVSGPGGKQAEKVFIKLAEIGTRAWLTAIGGMFKGSADALMSGNIVGAGGLALGGALLGGGMLIRGGVGAAKGAYSAGKDIYNFGKGLFKGSNAADATVGASKVAGAAAGAADDAADIAKTTKNLKDAAESFRAAANASKEAEKAVKTAEILKAAKQADLEKNARLLKELKKEAAKFGDDIPKGLSGKIMAAEKTVAKGRVDVKKAASHLDDMVNMRSFKSLEYANAREGFVVAKDVANATKAADQVGGVASKTGIFSKVAGWLGKNGEDVLKAGSKFAGKGIKGIPVLGTLLGLTASGAVVASAAPENRGREAAGEAGSWLGAIGAGAGAGALVGTLGGGPIGTAVGGIAGAIGGAIGGEAFTEWLYDQKDAIASMGEKVKTAISEFGTKAGESISGFFTETIPNFVTEQIPYAVGYVTGAIGTFFTATLPQEWNDFWTAVGNFFTETIPAWATGAYNTAVNFFTVSVPTFFTDLWNSVYGFFTETMPDWATGAYDKTNEFFTQKVPEFFDGLWNSVSTFVTESIPEHAKELKDKITGWFGNFKDWAGDIWDKVKSSFSAGYEAGSDSGSNVAKHAYGGIMTKPHMGIVAEAGPEAIIPLSGEKRQRGIELWQRTGELLGVRPYADGGIVGQAGTLNAVNTVGAAVSQVTDVSKSIADLVEKIDVSKMLRPLGQAAKTIGKGINKIGYGAEAVFKRLPVIGAGMMIGSAALDIASAEDKKQAVATNAGSILGSIAGGFAGGAALGATGGAIFGAPGAAIGGVIGGIAGGIGGAIGGEAFAEWVYGQKDKIEKAFGEAWENVKAGATTAGAWLGEQFTAAKNAVGEAWSGVSGWFEENVWGPIKTGATAAWNWVGEKLGGVGDWVGDKWTSFKDWLGGLGQKGSKATGLTTAAYGHRGRGGS